MSPWDIEQVNAIIVIVIYAGIEWLILSHGIAITAPIMKLPTSTRMGEVAHLGTHRISGTKNAESPNNRALTKDVRPVRPP